MSKTDGSRWRGWLDRLGGRARERSVLGQDSWLEILHKATTLCALGFGVWAYFHSVKPVFDKELDFRHLQERYAEIEEVAERRERERWLLIQTLNERALVQERLAREIARVGRRGIVLIELSEIRRQVEEYAAGFGDEPFDLRGYSLAYADANLRRLGSPEPESLDDARREALLYFRNYAERRLPPDGGGGGDGFATLLEDYDRESRGSVRRGP